MSTTQKIVIDSSACNLPVDIGSLRWTPGEEDGELLALMPEDERAEVIGMLQSLFGRMSIMMSTLVALAGHDMDKFGEFVDDIDDGVSDVIDDAMKEVASPTGGPVLMGVITVGFDRNDDAVLREVLGMIGIDIDDLRRVEVEPDTNDPADHNNEALGVDDESPDFDDLPTADGGSHSAQAGPVMMDCIDLSKYGVTPEMSVHDIANTMAAAEINADHDAADAKPDGQH